MKVLVVLAAVGFVCAQAAYSGYGGGYNGPQASPVVTAQGFLADTPEVAAAKAAHFSEFSKAGAPAGYAPGPYNGAPAQHYAAPVQHYASPAHFNGASITPQGFLADTPEVAAAKAAHLAEKAKTSGPSYGPEDDGSYKPEYDSPSYSTPAAPAYPGYSSPAPYSGYASVPAAPAYPSYSAPAAPAYSSYSSPAAPSYSGPSYNHGYSAPAPTGGYKGPLASPVVTSQGYLAETPEVVAAKAAHFAEVAKAGSPAPSHHRYRRSAVLAYSHPIALSYPLAYHAPVYSYAAPHYSGYSYSVRSW